MLIQSTNYVPGTMLSTVCVLNTLTLTKLGVRFYYYLHAMMKKLRHREVK